MSDFAARKIIHIDMDYFFAQVEEKDNPSLRDKPFAVGGNNIKRGVLCTCNYIARSYGVHSAMPTRIALQKCPELILLPTDFDKYKRISNIIRDIFKSISPLVEPLSLDEAYIDVTNIKSHANSATLMAQAIKEEILKQTGLTASAGVAPNKLLAKIASDINKPNGLYVIRPQDVDKFIQDLPVGKLFGVGSVTENKMQKMGLNTCADLQKLDIKALEHHFGRLGTNLYDYCRGIDRRLVNPKRIRKSLGVEHTYQHDLTTKDDCLKALTQLHQELLARLKPEHTLCIEGIFIKITDNTFHKTSIERHTESSELNLYLLLFDNLYHKQTKPIRLLGLGVKLSEQPVKQIPLAL
ncbi:DNA polymerase IV [Cysteiniphilum sp. QT6929]|uniref:DNA polymerase IV n=1 Tax=Cysteiniphilum sp. QT6929 TaxID=2975055 RepID=UPI0024B384D6|nr:DNA polymerase IV [Cysteiniphilum sp. QT6929]WHN65371.1 DNA polymerase IV [Cysteiniphilum sp. QT6929]